MGKIRKISFHEIERSAAHLRKVSVYYRWPALYKIMSVTVMDKPPRVSKSPVKTNYPKESLNSSVPSNFQNCLYLTFDEFLVF